MMESQQQSAEPKMYDGNPVAYWAWYRTQPRTRQCSELIERLCLFLSAAAVSVDRMSVFILNQPVDGGVPGCRVARHRRPESLRRAPVPFRDDAAAVGGHQLGTRHDERAFAQDGGT